MRLPVVLFKTLTGISKTKTARESRDCERGVLVGAHVRVNDFDLGQTPDRDPSSVLIHGKRNKQRRCPLWARTVNEVVPLVSGRALSESVFLNRCWPPLTQSPQIASS